MILKRHNEGAQAAIIYLYIVGFVLGIGLYIYVTPVVDEFTGFHVGYTTGITPLYPVSQNLEDSISITGLAIHAWPLIYMLILTIAAYAAALRQRSGYA